MPTPLPSSLRPMDLDFSFKTSANSLSFYRVDWYSFDGNGWLRLYRASTCIGQIRESEILAIEFSSSYPPAKEL